jgi:hypothetical protein
VSALPDSHQFAAALAEGHVILWAAIKDEAQEQRAVQILRDAAAQNVHVFERKGR